MSFQHVLLSDLSLDDDSWTFDVPQLPPATKLQKSGLIKRISLRTSEAQHSMVLELERSNENRAIEDIPRHQLLSISLQAFRPLLRGAIATEQPPAPDLRPRTGREVSDYAIRLLRAGIVINNVHYNFYGHSNSQLKSRSCFLLAESPVDISTRIEAMGDFSKMKTVGKKTKRIGLLFSSSKAVLTVSPERVEDIGDVELADYCFTDGCGLIAPSLAQDVARRSRIMFRSSRYTPSVFQIRYRGYKGVVTVDPRMAKQKPLLKLRKSMKKFSGGENLAFAAVDFSKPFSYGFLNDETIILLRALGIPQETLVQKQQEHFNLLSQARTSFQVAFLFLSFINRPDLAERVLLDGIEKVQPQIQRLVNAELGKMVKKRDEQRCRIFVQKSRLLFGVCDAWDVLKEGECAIKVTLEQNGLPYALKGMEVTVIRNPCLHPGDWQKFRVVERPELSHLVDCIVFSTRGKRPAADLMSGGDLDGDQFFVCWDPELIPSTVSVPAMYPGGRDPMQFRPITDDDRLVYFAKYTNASLGQVKNLYLDWARVSGPMSAPCQELNRLFSQCVDSNRIKVPEKLKTPPKPVLNASPFILDVLHDHSKERIHEMLHSSKPDLAGFDVDALQLLLSREDIAMSEFEFVKLAHAWCAKQATSFDSLLPLFDFNVLTPEQKSWILAHVPASPDVPALVQNALCSSSILSREELKHFQLDYPGIKWKRLYDSSIDRLGTFHEALTNNMALFQRTLLVFRLDDRLSIAIYIPRKVDQAQDCLIDNTGRLFAFPHSQGRQRQHNLALPTKMRYQLYCDNNVFQLFENQRSNSWIYLARPGKNDEEYRNITNQGDRRRKRQEVIDRGKENEVCASVALDKFSRQLQTHIGRVNRTPITAAEIYVISNRDVATMRNLDLWLEHIDTVEKLPLFSEEAKEYSVPTRENVVSSDDPSWLVEIVANGDLSSLACLETIEQYTLTFTTIRQTDDSGLLLQCFEYVLSHITEISAEPKSLLYVMVEFLAMSPIAVISFAPFFALLSEDQDHPVAAVIGVSTLPILQAFALSANIMGHLILRPYKKLLVSLPPDSFSLGELAEHLETISLTIRSIDLALDLLLDCLQPYAERLTAAEPQVVQHLLRNLSAIALDHIEEANSTAKKQPGVFDLNLYPKVKTGNVVEVEFRIDATATPRTSSHVRLTTASIPENKLTGSTYTVDALIVSSEAGQARFRCLHPLPPYFTECSWIIEDCGPYVTTKCMIDAVRDLDTLAEECCGVAGIILGITSQQAVEGSQKLWTDIPRLNSSQNQAIRFALDSPLLCLWGPPGTGKTETIVEMICALQMADEDARVLITAPTHNAVDNVMRRYMDRIKSNPLPREKPPVALRVSTEVRKVADDLRKYTCDAMAGQEINMSHKAMKEASKMVKRSTIIFTTCIGSGIGLLRSESFDIVVVDEASQQTEPSSMVPLVKGCSKVIMVGDHVQLRPTVNQTALFLDFDVSLFERLYLESSKSSTVASGLKTMMLDTQYRMHPDLCGFSSREFYKGELKSGISGDARPLCENAFPFPQMDSDATDYKRAIFINCEAREALGHASKENKGQADLCVDICKLLTTSSLQSDRPPSHSIVVLTPYTRQAELLRRQLTSLPQSIEVSSIDGFQGREADVVVFVTVRCNEHRNIGFLKDMRRMNVALTRARTALIVVGNRATLTEGTADEESSVMWKRLLNGMKEVKLELGTDS